MALLKNTNMMMTDTAGSGKPATTTQAKEPSGVTQLKNAIKYTVDNIGDRIISQANANNGGGGNGGNTKSVTVSTPNYSGGGGGSSVSVNPYASALSLLAQNYNNAVRSVNDRYALEEQKMAQENEDALRQAYINYMMSRKNMDTDMSRMGYTGGLTESNRARMYNNYGNIRSDLMKQRQAQLAEQNLRKNEELYNLLAQYNNQQMKYAL